MTFERRIARLSGLTDEGWERHANGWSVWTRFTGPALLMLAAWSRVWLGWWAFGVGALVVAWIAANPFLFARPASPNGYAARGTLGERIWMSRDRIAVPAKHRVLPPWLTLANALGFAAAIYGVVVLDACTVVLGLSVWTCPMTVEGRWFVTLPFARRRWGGSRAASGWSPHRRPERFIDLMVAEERLELPTRGL